MLHFLTQNAGLNYQQTAGSVALNQRLDARSSVSLNAVYSVFNYSGFEAGPLTPNFQTKGLNLAYQRVLTRSLSVSGSVGPQWISSSNSDLIPSTVNVAATASLAYTRRFTNVAMTYTRGANGGSGVLPGALSDSIMVSAGRAYGRNWTTAVSGAYTRSHGLTHIDVMNVLTPVNETYHTVYGGLQVTRRLGNNLSGYASYSLQDQSSNYPLASFAAVNALSGTSQTFGIGVTFTPRSTRLGQF